MQKKYPNCQPHMAYVKEHPFSSNPNPTLTPEPSPSPNPNQEHPSSSPCYGVHGRKKCEGFQLDPADPCNVQYHLFCEQLFKTAAQSWCPSRPRPPVTRSTAATQRRSRRWTAGGR